MPYINNDRPEKESKKKKSKCPIKGSTPIFITDNEMKFISDRPISKKSKKAWGKKMFKTWTADFNGFVKNGIEVEITIKFR